MEMSRGFSEKDPPLDMRMWQAGEKAKNMIKLYEKFHREICQVIIRHYAKKGL